MINLKQLFCLHEWEVMHEDRVELYKNPKLKKPTGYKYVAIMRCKKCGKLKKVEIKY